MKNFLLILFFSVLIQANCFSQLTVTPNSNAMSLAQSIAGSGLTVTSASLNCDGQGAGIFSYAGTTMSIPNGVLLTTGYASEAAKKASYLCSEETGNSYSDPSLTTIQSNAINDVCILTFAFVPLCNKISITFSFGSEEYPDYECYTDFLTGEKTNDAFGIFLTGANPAGGNYATGTNFALLNNGTPVSINNVNDGSALGYCTSASNIASYQVNYAGTDIAYGGLTKAITSSCSVVPCTNYTMEVAIADAGDEDYDSGVFIQANSISCANTPSITINSTVANCGTPGSATVTVTNYTGTPTYQWLPGNQTTAIVSSLTAGTYTCLVGLQSGCGTTTQTVTTVVGSAGASLTYSTTTQNPLCFNGANGNASVVVGGGTGPYTYTWTSTPPQNSAATTSTLPAGTYTVNVTDNIGCIGSTTVTLTNPPAIVATVTTSPTTCTGATGAATASVTSGGTAPYTYTWTTSAQTQTINNLAQGTYSVAISDVNNCTAIATGSVSTQGFSWTASATSTNPTCAGSATGTATATVTNQGTSTFNYSWNTTPVQTSVTSASLTAGNYTVTITDNNGCVSSASVTLTDPPPITATVNTLPTLCSGSTGSATVSILSGGTAPYTYEWLTSPVQTTSVVTNLAQATYSVLVVDVNACPTTAIGTVSSTTLAFTPVATAFTTKCYGSSDGTANVSITNPPVGDTYTYVWTPTGQTTATATNLAIGNYTVAVKDNNGCTLKAVTTVTQPAKISLSIQITPAICTSNSGTLWTTASGGTPPYTYNWNTSPAQTTQIATNLAQGPYTVLVTDVNTCTATATAIVGDSADLKIITSQSPDLCNKGVGKAIANPIGGAPYAYAWSTNPVQTTQVATGLQPGSYAVTVTDGYGCVANASVMVVNQNDVLSAYFAVTPAGTINAEDPIALNVTMNGNWSIDAAYLSNGVVIDQNPFPYIFAEYGNYSATYYYTSKNGCKDTVTYGIIVKDYITLYIPSAFTPNGDGRNDYFEVQGTFVNSFEMSIYDRWGVLIKQMNNVNTVWDGTKSGTLAPEDIYVYKGTASDIFGKHVTFSGQISLIR